MVKNIMMKKKILLVDGEDLITGTYRLTLASIPEVKSVDSVSNTLDAQIKIDCNRQNYGLIITADEMPSEAGKDPEPGQSIQLLNFLNDNYHGYAPPILAWSEKMDRGLCQKLMKKGALGGMIKPVNDPRFLTGVALELMTEGYSPKLKDYLVDKGFI